MKKRNTLKTKRSSFDVKPEQKTRWLEQEFEKAIDIDLGCCGKDALQSK